MDHGDPGSVEETQGPRENDGSLGHQHAGPLSGIRVIELANHLAAPTVGMYLADYGADVIKVESPGVGDELRRWGGSRDGVGLYFKVVNRNKRLVTADLRTPIGVEIVKRLVEDADVVVENFRPGTLARWGLDYDDLCAVKSDLIMLKVTGFGQTGPYSHRPGFGTLSEAYSGFAYTNGYPERPPLLPGFGLADATTGLMGAFLVLVALAERANSGCGQVIDLALYETLYTLLGPHVIEFDQLGIIQQRSGSRLPFTAPRNTYETADGRWVAISGSTQGTFERICAALGISEVVGDPRFSSNRSRIENSEELDRAIASAVGGYPLDTLVERFDTFDAPLSQAYSVDRTFSDPHYIARETVVSVDDDELAGPVRMQNVVGRLSRTPGAIRWAGESKGRHNRQILIDELGFDQDDLGNAGMPL